MALQQTFRMQVGPKLRGVHVAMLLALASAGCLAPALAADAGVRPATSPSPPVAATTPAAQIVAAARIAPQVDEFVRNFVRGWSSGVNNGAMPPQARQRAEKLVVEVTTEHLTPERLTREVEAALARLEPAQAAAALEWWRSPLGARIAAIDSLPSTPERQVELARFVGDLQVQPLPPARVQRMTELVAAMGVGEFMRTLTEQTMQGMLAAVRAAAAGGGANAPALEDLQEKLKGALDVLAVRAEQTVRLQLLYQYREISDEDLGRYLEFARSAPGKAYGNAVYGALTGSVARAATALGERLMAKEQDGSRT